MRKRAAPIKAPPSAGSAEDELDGFLEPIVNHGHQTDHDDDEDNHHGGVRRELVAGRPYNLAEFRDNLAVEQREPPRGPFLPRLPPLRAFFSRVSSSASGMSMEPRASVTSLT